MIGALKQALSALRGGRNPVAKGVPDEDFEALFRERLEAFLRGEDGRA